MKILITGATGFVGQKLGLELVKAGHEVIVISRQALKAQKSCPFPCTIIEADLMMSPISKSQQDSLKGLDVVYHLMGDSIAEGSWTPEKQQALKDSRILSTQHLRESLKNHQPKVFISASAIGIYGHRLDEELNEDSAAGQGFLAQLCMDWEAEAKTFSQSRVVMARIGLVISREGGILKELLPVFQAGGGGALAGGKQWMSWIHRDDLVKGLIFVMDHSEIQGPVNMVGPQPVTNSEWTDLMGKNLKRPTFFAVPETGLKVVLGDKTAIITDSQKVSPKVLTQAGFKFQYSDLAEALSEELKFHSQGEEVYVSYQYFSKPLEEVFTFFSQAENLERITPEFLNFKIETPTPIKIEEGTLIEYSLKLHGVPFSWQTKIEKWNPPYEFVDQQIKGPYALWHHTHTFEKLNGGTLMKDEVRFKLPMGFLGWLGGRWLVKKEVERIFTYRKDVMFKLYEQA